MNAARCTFALLLTQPICSIQRLLCYSEACHMYEDDAYINIGRLVCLLRGLCNDADLLSSLHSFPSELMLTDELTFMIWVLLDDTQPEHVSQCLVLLYRMHLLAVYSHSNNPYNHRLSSPTTTTRIHTRAPSFAQKTLISSWASTVGFLLLISGIV